MSDVIAIIPARSGSKTILNKNIQLLAGHPLIAYSIAVAKLSKNIDRVIVSTNSAEYANIAKHYGAEVPFIRPEKYSTDKSTDKDFLIHAIKWLIDNENLNPEYLVHLRPTTPLRRPSIVDEAINLIKHDKSSTALRSAHKAPESPLKWFVKSGPYFQGIIDNESYNLPKEEFNQVYIPNGYVDIIRSSFILNNQEIHGNRMIGFESPTCIEVDSHEEFEYIKYQLNKEGSVLSEYLNFFIK
jgi:CMP-N,N'-diacetyllegionaminic acid synthase